LAVPVTPERNLPARYNICPTDAIDVVIERGGQVDLVPMRWGRSKMTATLRAIKSGMLSQMPWTALPVGLSPCCSRGSELHNPGGSKGAVKDSMWRVAQVLAAGGRAKFP